MDKFMNLVKMYLKYFCDLVGVENPTSSDLFWEFGEVKYVGVWRNPETNEWDPLYEGTLTMINSGDDPGWSGCVDTERISFHVTRNEETAFKRFFNVE